MLINLNVIALLHTASTTEDLDQILSGVEGIDLAIHKAGPGVRLPANLTVLPDVVLYEIADPSPSEVTLLEEFIAEYHDKLMVIALGHTLDPALMRRLMRAGVRDVLPIPLSRQEVITACTNLLSEKRSRMADQGEEVTSICAFMNAKGGSGATLLAVNVAAALAHRKGPRVCLLDFDIQFGACAHMLDLAPKSYITDAVQHADRLDSVFLKALMTDHASGISILASPGTPSASMAGMTPAVVRQIIEAAAAVYDVVIIDLPRVIAPWTLEAIRVSTRSFIVLQNTLATIRDARLLLDHLPHAGVDTRKVELINNRAMAKSQSVSIDQLKQTLKKERVHRVRNDYATAVAAEDQGIPVYKVEPTSQLTADLEHLADYIWHEHTPAPAQEPSLLSKLFGRRKPVTQS